LAVRLQLIKARCFASLKTCAAVIEKTIFLFHAHRNSGYLRITFAVVEVSGQYLITKKFSDGFCQGPGTQKLVITIIVGVVFHYRTWCAFCPMGYLATVVIKIRKKKLKKVKPVDVLD